MAAAAPLIPLIPLRAFPALFPVTTTVAGSARGHRPPAADWAMGGCVSSGLDTELSVIIRPRPAVAMTTRR